MNNEVTKRLISLNDAAIRYGLSRQTFYRLIASGDLNLIKIGRASRLDVREADQLFGISE